MKKDAKKYLFGVDVDDIYSRGHIFNQHLHASFGHISRGRRTLFKENIMREQFKHIENYEGRYIISSEGRVFSLLSGKFMITPLNKRHKGDNLRVNLSKARRVRTFRIKKLVAQAFLPNPKNLPNVINIDKDPTNCSVSNLKWISREDQFKQHLTEESRQNFRESSKISLSKPVINDLTNLKYPSASAAESLCGLAKGFITNQITRGYNKDNNRYQFRYLNNTRRV